MTLQVGGPVNSLLRGCQGRVGAMRACPDPKLVDAAMSWGGKRGAALPVGHKTR